jgi:shikimate O-hydroxycinnamoyltransferase
LRDLVTVRVGDVLSQLLGFMEEWIKRAVSRMDDACAG